ncbi:MAG: hypothetical protein QXS20_00915 [Candidatus Thorarchaeota archaeon]
MLSSLEIELLSEPHLAQKVIEYFKDKYGKRFISALRAAEEGRVLKYQFVPSGVIAWTVQGRKREYLVVPEVYCSCRSFYQSVVISRQCDVCYHLLAQKIAESRGTFVTKHLDDDARRRLYKSWRRTD